MIAIADGESRFARYTRYKCTHIPKGASDCDKRKARSYWQIHKRPCPQLWAPDVDNPVRVAMHCAARLWAHSLITCGEAELAFSHYGGRGCIPWDRSKAKADLYWRIRGMQPDASK